MATVKDVAAYVRSKNAGPFWVTLEIFCDSAEAYDRLKSSPNIKEHKIAQLYGVDESQVQVYYLDSVRIIKFSYPRAKAQGHLYENDMHAGQQYIFLADAEV